MSAAAPHSPNLNPFAERWVRSVKQECLSKLILFGEGSLKRALAEFVAHYHSERNHQGKANALLCPIGRAEHLAERSIALSVWAVCCATTLAPLDFLTIREYPWLDRRRDP